MIRTLSDTPLLRLQRYRRLAAEAQELAIKSSDSDVRVAYLVIANSWTLLAEEIAKTMD